MANFRGRQTTAIATGLIFAVVICRLAAEQSAVAAAASLSPADEKASAQSKPNNSSLSPSGAAAAAAERAQQPANLQTACDSLFIANEKLAKYCLCKDQPGAPFDFVAAPRADQQHAEALRVQQQQQRRRRRQQQISQLSCQPNDLDTMSADLASATLVSPEEDGSEAKSGLTFQIDYLNINTNISMVGRSIAPPPATTTIVSADDAAAAAASSLHRRRPFQIDHISLQLQMRSPLDKSPAAAANQAESQLATIEQQMIDFSGLINETHLQFLSIFVAQDDGDHDESRIMKQLDGATTEVRLARSLAKFTALTRLELNFDTQSHGLLVEREMFRHQTHLKWLNLGSNRRLKLPPAQPEALKRRSPFAWATQLEYLSLESCNLEQFPLLSLFTVPFKLASNQNSLLDQASDSRTPSNNETSSSASSPSQLVTKSVFGLPNLSTLNLASNKLKSVEYDLFTSQDNVTTTFRSICQPDTQILHQAEAAVRPLFVLPYLTQLDLSENQLDGLTLAAGQYILCTMPNLSQLFLRRNKIKHLNLNSLLVYPAISPHPAFHGYSMADVNQPSTIRPLVRPKSSQLEYLDLSSNDLVLISGIVPFEAQESSTSTRIKSINLSQNKLANPITLLDATLMDRLVFDEAFNYNSSDNIELRLDNLDRSFRLYSGAQLSICDFLSPRSIKSSIFNSEDSLINEIVINENRLTKLTSDHFSSQQCAEIQILRLSANRIQSISDKAFGSLINLEQLDLSTNFLNHIEANTFMKTIKLRILDLARNRIKTLNKRLFSNNSDLEEIYLNDNELNEIPSELFASTSRLNVLDLSNNGLTHLDETIFSGLLQLRELNLNANQLTNANYLSLYKQIDNGIGKTMNFVIYHQAKRPMLEKKDKQQKQSIKSRNENARRAKTRQNRDTIDIAASNVLGLAKNQLESFIHATSFDSCDNQTFAFNIQFLQLNENKIKELTHDQFKCFPSIQRLNLQSNLLKSIESSVFKSLVQLEYVDLSKNQLTKLDLFKSFPQTSLKHLDISSNQLVSFSLSSSFIDETQLEYLDVSLNSDLIVDSAEFVEFLSKCTALRSQLKLQGIKQIKHDSNAKEISKQTVAKLNRLHLERLDLSGSSLEAGTISVLYHSLSMDNIGLESLSLGHMAKFINQAWMQRLIATRLQLELEQLDLSGNQLNNEQLKSIMNASNATGTATESSYSLKHLNLSSNILDSWPLNDLMAAKFAELKTLDLSRNKIRYFISKENTSFICYTLNRLEYLNLSSNTMIGLIGQPSTQSLQRVSLGKLMPSLRGIDLSRNRLSWIPGQFFEDLQKLLWLRLDHNQIETFPTNFLLTGARMFVQINFDHNINMRSLSATPVSHNPSEGAITVISDTDSLINGDAASQIILFSDPTNQIRCLPTDEYVRQSIRRYSATLYANIGSDGLESSESGLVRYLHASIDGDRELFTSTPAFILDSNAGPDHEHCRALIGLTRSLSFNSIGSNGSANLDLLWARDDIDEPPPRLYELSFRRNNLRTIEKANPSMLASFVDRTGVIKLDLSENIIENLPSESYWPDLMTLDLSRNGIRQLKLDFARNCSRLTLLDVGHNKISSLSFEHHEEKSHLRASLMVLILSHNSLTNLDGFPMDLLANLRLLDLRSNPLKSPQEASLLELQRPLLTVIPSQFVSNNHDDSRPLIRLDDSSIRFEWAENRRHSEQDYSTFATFSLGHDLYREKASQAIKFCRLNPTNLTRICLQKQESMNQEQTRYERCLHVKIPLNTMPCSTDLQKQQNPLIASNFSASPETNSSIGQSKKLAGSQNHLTVAKTEQHQLEQDIVLSFIDSMKKSWLKLREVDINEYLASNLSAGSVWVELGSRYQVDSLTVIKLAIVIGAFCTVGLLVAIFILLTYFSHSKVGHLDQSDSGSASELTAVTNPDSFLSSSTDATNRSTAIESNGSSANSRTPQSSLQSSGEETHLHDTVLERAKAIQRSHCMENPVDHDRNTHHQHQGPQICVTPSSSLAPSSIETAETMQAVDSIQSGTPNMGARGSVDQYTNNDEINSHQAKQQEHQQVATVMRMVKSNSATFDGSRQRIYPSSMGGPAYGTLNTRQQKYTSPRANMILQPLGYNILDDKNQSFHAFAGFENGANSDPYHQLGRDSRANYQPDPTTISLLSLSSVLSNSTTAGNFAGQQQAASVPVLEQQQQQNPGNSRDNQHSLCQYHSRMIQHQHQPPIQGNQERLAVNLAPHQPEVILEQEEDQPSYNPDASLHLSVHNLPPPPPPPRAMEALEFLDNTLYNYRQQNR